MMVPPRIVYCHRLSFFGASSEKSKKKMTAKMEIKLCRYGMDELVQMCGTSVITTLNASNAAGAVRMEVLRHCTGK